MPRLLKCEHKVKEMYVCALRGKNAWYLACNIVPLNTLDGFFEKCPNRCL